MQSKINVLLALFVITFSNLLFADEVTTSSTVTKSTSTSSAAGAPTNVISTSVTSTKTVTSDADSKIMGDIHNKFAKSTTLTGAELNATSDQGVVTITGTVTTQSQADEAVKIAADTDGVENVISQITVKTKTNPQ